MEDELEKAWKDIGLKIDEIVHKRADELRKYSINPVSQGAMCAEGGYMVGYYPFKGFDIRAYGWSPSSMKNKAWYKQVHWGTAMGDTPKELYKFAAELAKEAQTIWNAAIEQLELKVEL